MNIKLNYIEKGSGDALILLHGNGENNGYFVNQIDYFSRKYRVIAVDTRGHGKSPRGTMEFSIKQFARDLKAFIDEKDIDKAHILGFSDGGNIAMVFAMEYPERVNKLILNGANLNGMGVKLRYQLPIVMGYYITEVFKNKNPEAERNHELLSLMVKDPALKPQQLKKITAKTLVIAGSRDMIKTSHSRLIGRKIVGSSTVIMQGDHFIAARRPLQFNEYVKKFLDE